MTYSELKKQHQDEVNAFPFGFAFSNKQLEEMMVEWKLDPKEDLDKVTFLGSGIFLQKKDIKAFNEMAERHAAELKEFRKNEKEFIAGLVYQLHNHEYGYSRSWDDVEAACGALGLSEDDLKDPHTKQMLQRAIKQCVKEYNEMN